MSWAGSPAFRKRCGRSQPKHHSHSPFDLIQPRNFLEPALTGHTRFGFYILRFPNILYLFLTWVPPLSQPFGELADKLRQYPLLIPYNSLNTADCANTVGRLSQIVSSSICVSPISRHSAGDTQNKPYRFLMRSYRSALRAPISSRLRFPNILYLFQLEPPAFRNTAGGSNFYQKAVNSSKNEGVLAWNGEILVNLAIVEKIFKWQLKKLQKRV